MKKRLRAHRMTRVEQMRDRAGVTTMTDADKDPSSADAEPLLSTLLAESPQLWDIVEEFVRELPDRVTAMQDALRRQSFDQIESLARQLMDSGSDHGYDLVAEQARAIELAAHDHVVDVLTDKIAALATLVSKIQADLKHSED